VTVYEKRRDRGSEKRRVRAKDVFVHRRSTVLVSRDGKLPRARYIAERLGETGEHLEYPIVPRPQFPVGVFANVV